MAQVEMYAGQALSPDYILQIPIDDTETVITLNTLVGLVVPPGLLVLGADTTNPEVVKYTAPGVANKLVIERGIEGVSIAWGAATVVRNQLTAIGFNNMIDNIKDNATNVSTNTADIPNAARLTAGTVNSARLANAADTTSGVLRQKISGTELFLSFDDSDLSGF